MYTLLLHHVARYITLEEPAQQLFCDALEVKKLRKHQYLLQEGDICRRDYFIVAGGVRQYETTTDGREHTVHFGFEDWWMTDRHSLLTHTPSVYNIQALEATTVLQLHQETLETLYHTVPQLERYFHRVLQQTCAMWQQRILLLQKSAAERYEAFLKDYGPIEQRLSQQHIASYLGVTRETLSRLRSQPGRLSQ
ncbi:Crp/Fnr family transcriptional regulator [Chitinophaga nivalis]|uniref:Crp/Fnr family transcriptional regulator n=1 Tax=Chitinophaga nivalis TaxID=2991709 RepID=A0ABT3IJZ5_9BACT|nr:Crp/Fnr family transcriptional regulator [Chitinophaga nivalis]MCW3466023.1 Crp/Fnr family transcriptional regulator [Chitinophaga nivalis]MCW3484286.1 Crp/Fnr family transcriptional regulator [Chitinophaga nivalis]